MRRDDKLNSILYAYLFAETFRLRDDPRYLKFTFDFVVNAVAKEIEDWEIDFLRDRLFEDGYLRENKLEGGQPYLITYQGRKFIQTGGYVNRQIGLISRVN